MDDRSAAEVAKSLLDAFASKDRQAAEQLIAGGFHFTSPLDNRIDREAYFRICWPNSERVGSFELLRVFERGDEVAVTYVGRSQDGARFHNTEAMTCKDGRVTAVEVCFGWAVPHGVAPGSHADPA